MQEVYYVKSSQSPVNTSHARDHHRVCDDRTQPPAHTWAVGGGGKVKHGELGRLRETVANKWRAHTPHPCPTRRFSSARTQRQMTYHHFVNAAALAFAPYWIFYKARIAAQSETKSILMGAGFYVIAQFLELITLATFVSGGSEGQSSVEAAGSLLHILQVNLCSSSHALHGLS